MAQDAKKGFLLYYDYRKHLALLSDEDRGKLLMALLNYGERGDIPENLGDMAFMAFSFITGQMDRDAQKYAETCRKRSEAGKQGGRPKKETGKQEKAEKANAFSQKQTEAKKGAIPQELIDRINELSKKKKEGTLTEAEKEEQQELRKTYLAMFRENFRSHVEMLQVYDKDGNEVTPEKVKKIQRERGLRDN